MLTGVSFFVFWLCFLVCKNIVLMLLYFVVCYSGWACFFC